MLPKSSVGSKLLMAATGQAMILFVLFHAAGNSTVFFEKLNAYGAALHALPLMVYGVRLALFVIVALHIIYGIRLKLENRQAKPVSYAVKAPLSTTFAGRNMIWTGLMIAAFLIYHLPHFTFQVLDPATSAYRNLDAAGRPNLFFMVSQGFRQPGISFFYLLSVTALFLHLSHGIQSSFQTLGLNGERSFPKIRLGGSIAAFLLLLLYASIPLTLLLGLLGSKP
jgi:succinate dehydrogenase / fumarate reductase cytochrome b subunit